MSGPQYAIGIDLGTTHCALASALLARPVVRGIPIAQLVGPGAVDPQVLLPSCVYLAAPEEIPATERTLPWGCPEDVVGRWAQALGARSPDRLVASAKSWICHGGVNRRAPILPWNSPEQGRHISPFAAQVLLLQHLRAAWEAEHPGLSMAEQDVVVTVPASFDETARELTSAAAKDAGLGAVRLLEEPQAAFYDFLGQHSPQELSARLGDARLILVIDVGGGTTDLTLLRVHPPGPEEGGEKGVEAGVPRLERIAVGGHLMLGGDNMDAALALYALAQAGLPAPEDATTWSALVQSARMAKEVLLAADAPAQAVVSYQSRGRRLVGGTRSLPVTREQAHQVLLDGFLPLTGAHETSERTAKAGLTTLGLPYTHDVAIGRHVSTFLRRHAQAAAQAGGHMHEGLPRPDRVLLNGGVFNAPALIERLSAVLAHWFGAPVPLLAHTSLDVAVAHGAVRAALARRGVGVRVTGGAARAYYVGVEAAGGAQAMCVAPRGMNEGASVAIGERVFELLLNQPVTFPLFSHAGARTDPPGTLIPVDGRDPDLEALPPVQTILRDRTRRGDSATVPVTLHSHLSETGALELSLGTIELPPRRWRLEFALSRAEPKDGAKPTGIDDSTRDKPAGANNSQGAAPKLAEAVALVAAAFTAADSTKAKGLRGELERRLGGRGSWSAPTCRALADALLAKASACTRSEAHELAWLRLCGWCMRPGFGAPADEARVDALWALRETGLQYPSRAQWAQWWITWRWVAAGLDADRQAQLFAEIQPWLWPGPTPPAGPHHHGPMEMLQLLAALERLGATHKQAIGDLILAQQNKLKTLWPLGRVGARVLFHGDAADAVPREVAEEWLGQVLAMDWAAVEGASFAAAALGRLTGDPRLDVDSSLRAQVATRLVAQGAPTPWIDMLTRVGGLSDADRKGLFGDSLPAGLRLG